MKSTIGGMMIGNNNCIYNWNCNWPLTKVGGFFYLI